MNPDDTKKEKKIKTVLWSIIIGFILFVVALNLWWN